MVRISALVVCVCIFVGCGAGEGSKPAASPRTASAAGASVQYAQSQVIDRRYLATGCILVQPVGKNRRFTRVVYSTDGSLTLVRDVFSDDDAKRLFPDLTAVIRANGGDPTKPSLVCTAP